MGTFHHCGSDQAGPIPSLTSRPSIIGSMKGQTMAEFGMVVPADHSDRKSDQNHDAIDVTRGRIFLRIKMR